MICTLCCRWWRWYKTYLFQWSPWWTVLPQQPDASLLPVVTSLWWRRSPPLLLRVSAWVCSARRRRWPLAERCRERWECSSIYFWFYSFIRWKLLDFLLVRSWKSLLFTWHYAKDQDNIRNDHKPKSFKKRLLFKGCFLFILFNNQL